jgi:hypothetical protein
MRSLFLWGYAQKIILGISIICRLVPADLPSGRLFFSHAFLSRDFQRGILNKNHQLWMVTLLYLFRFRAVREKDVDRNGKTNGKAKKDIVS